MSDHVKMLRYMRERFGESPLFSEEREALDAAISSLRQVPEADRAFNPGDRIEWLGMNGIWFPGTIVAVRALVTMYDAKLDDGCDAENFAAGRFRKPSYAPPTSGTRKFRGVGELERSGYIPEGSAAEREANPAPPTSGPCRVCDGAGGCISEGDGYGDESCDACDGTGRATPAHAGAELPELPGAYEAGQFNRTARVYTADQMRVYAELARRGGSDG